MGWYSKYLEIYEKPFGALPQAIIGQITTRLQSIQSETPEVSVIFIAHNEGKRIAACLWSLADNISKYPIEILGVNNNSSDNTGEVCKILGIRCFEEMQKGPGHARNRGIKEARGKYVICIDADTLYPPHYIETMITALKKPGISAVFALWSYIPDKEFTRNRLLFYEFLRDLHINLLYFKSPERCVRGMTFAHYTEPARSIGYKTNIRRGEDGYMAYKLKSYGKIYFVRSRRARVMTSTGTVRADGSIVNALKVRILSSLKGFRKYFVKTRGEIKDQDSNLLK